MKKMELYLIGSAAVAVIIVLITAYFTIYNRGYNDALEDVQKITNKAVKQADKDVADVKRKAEPEIKIIRDTPDSLYGVGPITSSVLDSLQ